MRTHHHYPPGKRVQIMYGAGLDSGKFGQVIPPELDHRGIPKVRGAYHPYRPSGPMEERMIRLEDGTTTVMFVALLREAK